MKYLVTGAAGFIGSAVVEKLTEKGHTIVGIDNMNDYYDVALKEARLKRIEHPNFHFIKLDIANRNAIEKLFSDQQFDRVIHLAAQAGVRYSIQNPPAHIKSSRSPPLLQVISVAFSSPCHCLVIGFTSPPYSPLPPQ